MAGNNTSEKGVAVSWHAGYFMSCRHREYRIDHDPVAQPEEAAFA